jgi:solute:Na+ symporter, SSS family
VADTCSEILGLPTCAEWKPDPYAFIMLLTHQAPSLLGGWCLVGIVAASMSTASGAILAMGTVFSHNIMRQFDPILPKLITHDNLLQMSRLATIPMALISAYVAIYSGKTAYVSKTT